MARGDEHTLGRWISDRDLVTPDRIAIRFRGRDLSYRWLHERSDQAAASLRDAGLARGDRIAVLAGNCPEYAAAVFGCAKAGLVVVPLSWRLAAAELGYQIADADVALVVHDAANAGLASDALKAVGAVGRDRPGGPGDPALVELATLISPRRSATGDALGQEGVADSDPLFIVYTSGTTGRPKGAILTHANCFWTNLSLDLTAGVAGSDRVLQVLPQFHIAGWNVQPLLAWWKGATVVLEETFAPERVLRLIAEERITTMMGVPANYLFLAEHPDFAAADLTSLRYLLVGGAPMPEPLLRRWTDRGVRIVQGYGLTEAAPNVLCLPPEDAERMLGYAGKPYPYVDVAIADPATGDIRTGPATGELLVRGPNVFPGFWRNQEASASALRDGWLHTGDIAERDDEGYYRIRDRLKDMYISGGENVYPAEVEAVLHDHPAVAEAAVIAIGDPRWGEAGLAVVVTRAGHAVSEAELREFCAGRIAGFKVPKTFRFTDGLPRSGMNKVLKSELRARYASPETP